MIPFISIVCTFSNLKFCFKTKNYNFAKRRKSEIMEIVRPFVDKEQEDSLMRMVQAFGAMDDMKGAGIEPVN